MGQAGEVARALGQSRAFTRLERLCKVLFRRCFPVSEAAQSDCFARYTPAVMLIQTPQTHAQGL